MQEKLYIVNPGRRVKLGGKIHTENASVRLSADVAEMLIGCGAVSEAKRSVLETLPVEVDLGAGNMVSMETVVAEAHKRSGLSIDAFRALADDDLEQRLADAVTILRAEAAQKARDDAAAREAEQRQRDEAAAREDEQRQRDEAAAREDEQRQRDEAAARDAEASRGKNDAGKSGKKK